MDIYRQMELESEAEISWFFNDINLTMVIILLFFAVTFALMVSATSGAVQSDYEADIVKEQKPTELSSLDYYGDTGFPKATFEKGFPIKDTFNTDLILTDGSTVREGMEGNVVWDFEELSAVRDKKLLRVEADTSGVLRYEGEVVAAADMRQQINQMSAQHNVFVELYIDPAASVGVYQKLRDELWNESSAIHWRFITEESQAIAPFLE